jgi:glycosyltransferase involved in cell wall biosynthesis
MKNKNFIFFMPFIGGGGVEKNLFIITNYLSKKIKNIKICTISKNKKNKFNKNIKFITTKKNVNKNFNIRIKYFIALMILTKYLIKNKNSVVISFQANIYCIILCKILNVKIVVRSNSSPSGWYHNFIKKFIYGRIIKIADIVIVNSFEFKKQMDKNFSIVTKCIYNPLNFKKILKYSNLKSKIKYSDNSKKNLKILNIGRLTEQKDQITILKAAKVLKEKKINFEIIILGSGIMKNQLKEFIKLNYLYNHVKIFDYIENPYPIIKKANLFILSSKYEGLPNVLLESATLKKFIITTKCPTGPKEIICNGKGGDFFKIGDYYDLVRKILFFINNKKIVNKKITYSYKNLRRFDYNKNLDKYYNLLISFNN